MTIKAADACNTNNDCNNRLICESVYKKCFSRISDFEKEKCNNNWYSTYDDTTESCVCKEGIF